MPEIQSLDLYEIVQYKVREAYEHIRKPVLVEDVSLEFHALGKLPGPFIKWFEQELGYEKLCRLIDGQDRGVTVRCVYGYKDRTQEKFFEASNSGTIPLHPYEGEAFSWDPIFIPEGYSVTRAELSPEDDLLTYKKNKPIEDVGSFLRQL